jgi:hypothetical protein
MMRRYLFTALPVLAALALSTGTAQAVVLDVHAVGQSYVHTDTSGAPDVNYPTDSANYVGVALVPGSRSSLTTAGIPYVASSGTCSDPTLTSDLALANFGLCYHGGSVINRNETFALTWDPLRRYWSGTRAYVEQFLRDLADASGKLSSPFALTSQYSDASGPALNQSKYGGGCIDYGNPNNVDNTNTTCLFASSVQTGPGTNYPTSACTPTNDQTAGDLSLQKFGANTVCLTDTQVRNELSGIVDHMSLLGKTQPGYTPLIAVLVPPQVEVCLDAGGAVCSANSGAPVRFCSYHSHVTVSTPSGSREVDYVVQPWTALTKCDEPDVPSIAGGPPPAVISKDIGIRLVSPLSQALIPAIVDPQLNGWFALNGSEIDDNGCVPLPNGLDNETLAGTPYVLQREFNNGAALESDPFTYGGCAPDVILGAKFVVPSPIDQSEVVGFDGSTSQSTLVVPNADYAWSFGDGSTATGPSVIHSFAKSGYYKVKLTVTDRGGNVSSLTKTVEVLGPNGQAPGSNTGSGGLQVRVQLLPQSLRGVLRSGLAVQVKSNEAADGFATLSIFRSAAHRARLASAGNPNSQVVIGRGTVSGVKKGTVRLRMRVSSATAKKLAHAGHLTFTLHLTLYGKGGARTKATAVGRY